jgi:hypothetical protein
MTTLKLLINQERNSKLYFCPINVEMMTKMRHVMYVCVLKLILYLWLWVKFFGALWSFYSSTPTMMEGGAGEGEAKKKLMASLAPNNSIGTTERNSFYS